MKTQVLAVVLALLPLALGAPTTKSQQIILRDVAEPRFFGAAANTTFLYHDKNYTEVISTQVSLLMLCTARRVLTVCLST